jgi:hypothetical protein
MNDTDHLKDLVVLVADKDMESAFRGILSRFASLDIRPISFDIFVHPQNDPACLKTADQYLSSFINQYRFALVAFDREGSGRSDDREILELEVEKRLASFGWQERSAVIVFEPELEVWVWSRSSHVDEILGWANQPTSLRAWLIEQNYLPEDQYKPQRPKEAMEAVLKKVKKPRSASIYLQLAQKVSLKSHTEPAFVKLHTTLQKWFPRKISPP